MPFARYFCIFINVGLGEGSALPVGVPVPWPSVTPPTGWLKCNGAAFSAEEYPELAKVYPTNKLLDLRGEFIRGWDDGRGIDSGRTLLSAQDGSIEAHGHDYNGVIYTSSGPSWANTTDAGHRAYSGFTSSYGGSETRPRNIAFNYIVRAA
ncbi:phage tail protein [Escherichia coli]|uniref:phage tail protein n=1 Tax=Escherichia coli TaxID=562 RepID=UPI0012FE125C|nr:phage tail protein [Escherichia coli]MVW07801.1 phage tail protein [Escherichia coli]NEM66255.1 phage tail protein [Escherichia coli]